MTDVKMPKPVIRDMEPYCEPTGFTEAQMRQFRKEGELEALEMAAKVCDAKADRVNSTWIPHECAFHIRALAKEIKMTNTITLRKLGDEVEVPNATA